MNKQLTAGRIETSSRILYPLVALGLILLFNLIFTDGFFRSSSGTDASLGALSIF